MEKKELKDVEDLVINLKNDKYKYIIPKQTKIYYCSFSYEHKIVNITI